MWISVGECFCCVERDLKENNLKQPASVRDVDLSTASVRDVDLSTIIYIITHGGCADGQASAWIMSKALKQLRSEADVHVIQGAHGYAVSPEGLISDSVLLFVDICPVQGDAENIRAARQVYVMDHHPTQPDDIAPLIEEFGEKIIDLSVPDTSLGECGASLVQQFCKGTFSMSPDLLELFWKLDVFKHEIPNHLQGKLNGFKGWIFQNGNFNVSMELVEAMMTETEESMIKGEALYDVVIENTINRMKGVRMVHAESGLKVYLLDLDALMAAGTIGDLKYDPMIYQSEIDKLKEEGVAVAFLTVSRKIIPTSGNWILSLRRAGDQIDMGKVAVNLRDNYLDFPSGGGHPYAAAAQCKSEELDEATLVVNVVASCRSVLYSCSGEDLVCPVVGWGDCHEDCKDCVPELSPYYSLTPVCIHGRRSKTV